jgi:hypothetical protein
MNNPSLKRQDKSVAIVQSNYIPWKGYFDLIHSVDEFILYDDVQYTKRDWRNRNQIKTQQGLQWLTIPVEVKGKFSQSVRETKIASSDWAKKHWQSIATNYARAPFFKDYKDRFEALYLTTQSEYLSEVNFKFLESLKEMLGISTPLLFSSEYGFEKDEKNQQLLKLCHKAGATRYLSGPAAAGYLDVKTFESEGVSVSVYDYSGYPEYRQSFPPFEHAVSAIDLILNEGPSASQYLKSFKPLRKIA